MSLGNKRVGFGAALATAALLATALVWASEDDGDSSRYPYDPACAWGRVANGKGMLLRCLTEQESLALSRGPGRGPEEPKAGPASSRDPRAAQSDDAGSASGSPDARSSVELSAEVVAVRVDSGKLPAAQSKLSTARGRFVQCVREHGGLTAPRAEAHVRFLVRERGRAEGVSVVQRKGMSKAAADCIAGVVDRRSVGVPETPLVGATVVIGVSGR